MRKCGSATRLVFYVQSCFVIFLQIQCFCSTEFSEVAAFVGTLAAGADAGMGLQPMLRLLDEGSGEAFMLNKVNFAWLLSPLPLCPLHLWVV